MAGRTRSAKQRPPIRVGVVPLFPTWIYECIDGPAQLLRRLERLDHELMRHEANATKRTNQGGWHYAFDLFQLDAPPVAELRDRMEQHVQAFLNHVRRVDRRQKDRFRLQGWINVNRADEVLDFPELEETPGAGVLGDITDGAGVLAALEYEIASELDRSDSAQEIPPGSCPSLPPFKVRYWIRTHQATAKVVMQVNSLGRARALDLRWLNPPASHI